MKMKMCVLFVILALGSQHASGVEVYKGEESVLLPCQFAVPEDYVVVWRRDDLSSPIIHTIVEGKDDLRSQNHHYASRTSMRADALQSGDLSLTLRNPTFTDSGTYTCVTRSRGVDKDRTEVQLKVTERPPVWPKVFAAGLVLVILVTAVVFFILYCLTKRKNIVTASQLTPVLVTEGTPFVLLPYQTKCAVSDIGTVKWVYVKGDLRMACMFKDGQTQRDKQHEDYKDRADMESNTQTPGDFSLTLKNPVCADGGVYICSIYDKHGNILRRKIVTLLVKENLSQSLRGMMSNIRRAPTESHYTSQLNIFNSVPPQQPNEYENVGEADPLNA